MTESRKSPLEREGYRQSRIFPLRCTLTGELSTLHLSSPRRVEFDDLIDALGIPEINDLWAVNPDLDPPGPFEIHDGLGTPFSTENLLFFSAPRPWPRPPDRKREEENRKNGFPGVTVSCDGESYFLIEGSLREEELSEIFGCRLSRELWVWENQDEEGNTCPPYLTRLSDPQPIFEGQRFRTLPRGIPDRYGWPRTNGESQLRESTQERGKSPGHPVKLAPSGTPV